MFRKQCDKATAQRTY